MKCTIESEGTDKIADILQKLGDRAEGVASMGLYGGAKVMADAVKHSADNIRTEPFHYTVFGTRMPSPEEKEVVQAGNVGIAKFKRSGDAVNTSVGFQNAGYAMLAGKRKPIPKIANAINSGTSFMRKQPFFRQAAQQAADKTAQEIEEIIEAHFQALNNIIGG